MYKYGNKNIIFWWKDPFQSGIKNNSGTAEKALPVR